jgi:flagellar biosynthesis chaperone FliJ
MAIKVTLQKDIVLVRRWQYSSERKRSLPTNVYSVKRYQAPSELPSEVVEAHGVTAEEQQTYTDFVTELDKEMEVIHAKVGLRSLSDRLNAAKVALEDPELKETISLDEYENLSDTINEIKKLVTKNKNALKRKTAKQEKA